MFNSLNLRALTNPEFQQFTKLLLGKVAEANPEVVKVKTPYDALSAIYPKLEAALNQEKANEETKLLAALDDERDDYFVGLTYLINGYALGKDTAKKEAAVLIRLFLKAQGRNVVRQNYQAETAILTNVVQTLKGELKYKEAITALGLQDWITDLETANQNFETRFKSRNTSLSKTDLVPAFIEIRKEAIPAINRLLGLIESRYTTAQEDKQPTAAYESLIGEINTLIDSFIPYTLPKKKEETPTTPPPANT